VLPTKVVEASIGSTVIFIICALTYS
jgi:hypothetical protein